MGTMVKCATCAAEIPPDKSVMLAVAASLTENSEKPVAVLHLAKWLLGHVAGKCIDCALAEQPRSAA